MSLLNFKRKINHYGQTNYVNIPPVLLEMLKAKDAKEVIVSDDLENDCIRIKIVREGENERSN